MAVGIRVRMYRVGFGDCFLVTLADKHHILIDCGVYKGKTSKGDIGTMEDVVKNIAEVTKKHLDLVIMTHRHADHIAGFGRHEDIFRTFTIDAVWMPVWENEYNPAANAFQLELEGLAEELQHRLDLTLAADEKEISAEDKQTYHRLGNATGIEPLGADEPPPNKKSKNKVALYLLKTAFAKPQYLKAGDQPALPAALAALGVTARVLGPPPVDEEDLLKLMDLKKHVGQYLAMADEKAAGEPWQPFGRAWFEDKPYPAQAFSEWMRRDDDDGDDSVADARGRLQKALARMQPDFMRLTAGQLDDYLNNQSLVVLFTYKGKTLLFSGDAQGGNWIHWLYETGEPIKAPTDPLAKSAQEILDELDVYKVGHHGSTNSTPIVVAENIRKGSVALCSTQEGTYPGASAHGAVPHGELSAKLAERCTFVRSDLVDAALPKPKAGKLSRKELWVDYDL